MNHDGHAIFAVLVIEFDQIGSGFERQFKGEQGVFGRNGAVAAVADNEWSFSLKECFGNRRHAVAISLKTAGLQGEAERLASIDGWSLAIFDSFS